MIQQNWSIIKFTCPSNTLSY